MYIYTYVHIDIHIHRHMSSLLKRFLLFMLRSFDFNRKVRFLLFKPNLTVEVKIRHHKKIRISLPENHFLYIYTHTHTHTYIYIYTIYLWSSLRGSIGSYWILMINLREDHIKFTMWSGFFFLLHMLTLNLRCSIVHHYLE
jgi:hypothetical protein